VEFVPSDITFVEGKTTDIALYIDPHGGKDYTAVLKLSYPATLVSVKNFIQADGWVPIAPEGYDTIDNEGGTLKKTAGYPRGITERTLFGTITFVAKNPGTGAVSVQGGLENSLVFDKDGGNVLDLSVVPTLSLQVDAAPRVAPTDETTPPEEIPAEDTPAPVSNPQIPEKPQLTAAVGDALPLSTSGKTVLSVVLFLIIVGAYVFIWKSPTKKP
jgi:hypothetical protein